MTYQPVPIKTAYGPITPRVTSRHVALRRAWQLVVRRRHYVAPVGGANAWGAWIYAEHLMTNPGLQTTAAYGLASALAGIGTAVAVNKGVRDGAALYGGTLVTGTMAWSAWQVTAPSLPGAAIGLVCSLAACVPYWKWHAKHRLDRDKLDRKILKGQIVNDLPFAHDDVVGALSAIGVPGASLEQIQPQPDGGWVALVTLPTGKSVRDVATAALQDRLQGALRLPVGWALELTDGGSAHHLIVIARPPAPQAEVAIPTVHPVTHATTEWDPWQPLLAAIDVDNGEEVFLHLLGRAGILIAGLQRMGKSVLLSVIVAHLALSRARLVLADAKLVELSLWAPLCQREDDFVGRDPAVFLAKLLELQKEIDRRYAKLVEEGRTKAAPGDGWEPIALIVDELAAFIDIPDRKLRAQIVSVLRDIVSRGPASGVPVILATQKPEDKVVPSQIRDVCGQKVALATTTPQMTDTILGQGWAAKGATAHLFGETDKGAAYLLEDGKYPRHVQTLAFEPEERRQVIKAAHALWPDRSGAHIPLPSLTDEQPEPDPTSPDGRPRLRSVPCFPDGTQIPDNRVQLWKAMDQAGPSGFTINDLVALGLPNYNARTSVDGPLQQWRRLGWVVEIGTAGRAQLFALTHHAKAA